MPEEEGIKPAEVKDGEPSAEEEKDFRDFVGIEHDAKSDPAWDNRRFRQIYRKHKDDQRETQQLRTDMKAAGEHTRRLTEAAERITTATERVVKSEAEKRVETAQGEISQMETSLGDLKSQRKNARTEQNWDKVDEIEDQIQALTRKIDRKRDAAEKEAKEKPPEVKTTRPDTEAIKEFVQGTPWYDMNSDNFDPLMVSAAKEYDTALMNKPEYLGKIELTAQRLKKVKEYIEKRFDWKDAKSTGGDGGGERRSRVEGVGSEHRGESGSRGKISLDGDQKRVAHLMLDEVVGFEKAEAEYLRQLKVLGGGEV